MLRIGVLLALTSYGLAAGQERGDQGLHFVVAINDYYDVVYAKPPVSPALYVVFAGEPIELRLAIGNRNATTERIALHGLPIHDAFRLTALRVPEGAPQPTLTLRPAGRVEHAQLPNEMNWGDEVALPGSARLVLRATIDTAPSTVPGLYELQITPSISATTKINPLGTILRYEIRQVSPEADRIEGLCRRMLRLYNHEEVAEAQEAADQLLAVYPRSAIAYRIKGHVALTRGRRNEA
jgi:hypothetical protein